VTKDNIKMRQNNKSKGGIMKDDLGVEQQKIIYGGSEGSEITGNRGQKGTLFLRW